jgi:hypothetical protein
MASAHLWLAVGIHLDDVVNLIQVRRRFDIPAAHSWARAREIATTAQCMMVRRKIA